jgi:hypothetical protein
MATPNPNKRGHWEQKGFNLERRHLDVIARVRKQINARNNSVAVRYILNRVDTSGAAPKNVTPRGPLGPGDWSVPTYRLEATHRLVLAQVQARTGVKGNSAAMRLILDQVAASLADGERGAPSTST